MDSSRSRDYKYSIIKLIEAVKVRPQLWDSSRTEFRSYKYKDKVWQEVFEELDDNYRFLNENEQSVIAMNITTKWRNIRDVFIRSIKKRATDRKMKKYMYHDRLSFMLKLYKSYIRPDSPIASEDDYSNLEAIRVLRTGNRSYSYDNDQEKSSNNKQKASSASPEEEILTIKTEPNDIDDLTKDEIGAYSRTKNVTIFDDEDERTTNSLNHDVESENGFHRQNEEAQPCTIAFNQSTSDRNLENIAILRPDEDEAFMISILPALSDMNLDEKLEFRLAVLQKICEIRSKRRSTPFN